MITRETACWMGLWLLMPLMAGCKAPAAPTGDKPATLGPSAVPAGPAPAAAPTPAPALPAAPEAAPEPPAAAESITGTITLPKTRRKDVKVGETLWIIARSAQGGPPLAIQRHAVADFPLAFALSARDAMIPGMAFQGEINISARVDRDGNPMTRSKGEIHGAANGVKVGATGVSIALDSVQTEDASLGGAGRPAGTPGVAPHGLPPGHP